MDCRKAFEEAADSKKRCERMVLIGPECCCESTSVSAYSPGKVQDAETVARLIYSPFHTDPVTGEVTEAAFSDVKDKGLSVTRRTYATSAEIHALGMKKLADDHAKGKIDREFLGAINGNVSAIREATLNGQRRAFCVYDSAVPDNPAHADVCQTAATPLEMKRARQKLRDLFSKKPAAP